MAFASICEHASSVFIFVRTSSWQIFLASSEHFRNYRWRAASTLEKYRWRAASTSSTSSYFVNFPLAGISLLLIGNIALRQVIVNNRAETSKSGYRVLYSGRNIDFTLKNQCPTRPFFSLNFFGVAVRFDWIKFDVWLKLGVLNYSSRPKLSLGSAHVMYDVWPGPKLTQIVAGHVL